MNILFFLTPKQDVATLEIRYTVRQATEKLRRCGYTAVPVLDEGGRYCGSLTEGDLLYAFAGKVEDWEKLPIRGLLRESRFPAVHIDAEIGDLLQSALAQNYVPVVDDRGCLIGIVTRRKIIQYLISNRP
ncbi:MAG: CBS domain-containing protein [Clostridiales bacterium]|nr:CBS domain-containing protein [Clostridiales bacterium]